ncbi:MAG: HIT family protein [Candidatus Komeilibacteria bacterium]|nr:HIT family protein [Candidatus Komeilibacteria bacterium]
MGNLPKAPRDSIIYEDEKLYVCLAKEPITVGHTVVIMKKVIKDLELLSDRDYDYLMDTVFAVRNALLVALKVKKVYLLYMDEANNVHWHLIPRYKKRGFAVFDVQPVVITDFKLAKKIRKNLLF